MQNGNWKPIISRPVIAITDVPVNSAPRRRPAIARAWVYGASIEALTVARRWTACAPVLLHTGRKRFTKAVAPYACLLMTRPVRRNGRRSCAFCPARKADCRLKILATTFSKLLEPRFEKIQFNWNGLKSGFTVGDMLHVALGPILNPVTKQPESVSVNHGTGFVFKEAECASADEFRLDAGELKFSWPKKAAFVTKVTYSN